MYETFSRTVRSGLFAIAAMGIAASPVVAQVAKVFSDNGDNIPALPSVDVGGPWSTNAAINQDGTWWLWHQPFTTGLEHTLSEGPLAPGGSAAIQAAQQASMSWRIDAAPTTTTINDYVSYMGEMLFTARTGLGDASSEVFGLRLPEQDPIVENGSNDLISLEYFDPAANAGAGNWIDTGYKVPRRTYTDFTVDMDFAAQTWDLHVEDIGGGQLQLADLPFKSAQSTFDHVAFQFDVQPMGPFVRVGMVEVTTIPEPSTMALTGLVALLIGLPGCRRRLKWK